MVIAKGMYVTDVRCFMDASIGAILISRLSYFIIWVFNSVIFIYFQVIKQWWKGCSLIECVLLWPHFYNFIFLGNFFVMFVLLIINYFPFIVEDGGLFCVFDVWLAVMFLSVIDYICFLEKTIYYYVENIQC